MNNKVALVTDTHFGIRNDHPYVLNFFCDFFENTFFPKLLEENITHIIHCGDLVDRRKFVNYNTATKLHECFTNNVIKNNMNLDIIVGNHDCTFKNTNKINALNILYNNYSHKNIKWFIEPTINIVKGKPLLYLPWICDENYDKSVKMIEQSHDIASFVFGHLELLGFEMYKGAISDIGLNRRLFENYQHVWSGHFHHRSTIGNITFIGTPYEMMWSDWNDIRGFEILDLDTGESEFIQNNKKLFHVINFNEYNPSLFNSNNYKHSFIKIIIQDQNYNETKLETLIDTLSKVDPIDLIVINQAELDLTVSDIDLTKIEDTMHTIKSAIDIIDDLSDKRKKDIVTLMYELHTEAQQLKD
jgi:hypothetical protein